MPILIVHSDPGVLTLLVRSLSSVGQVSCVESGEQALDRAAGGAFRVVLLGLDLPAVSGLETLRLLRALTPPPEVVLLAREDDKTLRTAAMRSGAFDLVGYPLDQADLTRIVRAASERFLQAASDGPTDTLGTPLDIVGTSAALAEVLALLQKAAPADCPVLIQGESGTGKELAARALHARSARAKAPLVILDCGALTDTLLESELFGHERGAFTGAQSVKHGLFEVANHGTIFLDEIGEMSPLTQVKVLRALQSGEFRRLGSNRLMRSDVRIIAATNRDLRQEVRRGRFREDLYYRIAVVEVTMPPLRARSEDIPLLVEHFLHTAGRRGGRRIRITPDAMARLAAHPWPGNIRELRNCIERLSVLAQDDLVTTEALPPSILERSAAPPHRTEIVHDLPLEEVERRHILQTLERHQWNKRRTAAILGIDTKTLYNKLRRYGIPASPREPRPPSTPM